MESQKIDTTVPSGHPGPGRVVGLPRSSPKLWTLDHASWSHPACLRDYQMCVMPTFANYTYGWLVDPMPFGTRWLHSLCRWPACRALCRAFISDVGSSAKPGKAIRLDAGQTISHLPNWFVDRPWDTTDKVLVLASTHVPCHASVLPRRRSPASPARARAKMHFTSHVQPGPCTLRQTHIYTYSISNIDVNVGKY